MKRLYLRSVINHWQRFQLSRCWMVWKSFWLNEVDGLRQLGTQKVYLRTVINRWQRLQLLRGWKIWKSHWRTLERERKIAQDLNMKRLCLRSVINHWQRFQLLRCWMAWKSCWLDEVDGLRQLGIKKVYLRTVINKLQRLQLSAFWKIWKSHWKAWELKGRIAREIRMKEFYLRGMINHWQRFHLSRCWTTWKSFWLIEVDGLRQLSMQKVHLRTVINHWQRLQLSRCWKIWKSHWNAWEYKSRITRELNMKRLYLRSIINHWERFQLFRCWMIWKSFWLNEIGSAQKLSLQNVYLCTILNQWQRAQLLRCWRIWKYFWKACESEDKIAQELNMKMLYLQSVINHWYRCQLWRCWTIWKSFYFLEVECFQRFRMQKLSLRTMVIQWQRFHLLKCWRIWKSFWKTWLSAKKNAQDLNTRKMYLRSVIKHWQRFQLSRSWMVWKSFFLSDVECLRQRSIQKLYLRTVVKQWQRCQLSKCWWIWKSCWKAERDNTQDLKMKKVYLRSLVTHWQRFYLSRCWVIWKSFYLSNVEGLHQLSMQKVHLRALANHWQRLQLSTSWVLWKSVWAEWKSHNSVATAVADLERTASLFCLSLVTKHWQRWQMSKCWRIWVYKTGSKAINQSQACMVIKNCLVFQEIRLLFNYWYNWKLTNILKTYEDCRMKQGIQDLSNILSKREKGRITRTWIKWMIAVKHQNVLFRLLRKQMFRKIQLVWVRWNKLRIDYMRELKWKRAFVLFSLACIQKNVAKVSLCCAFNHWHAEGTRVKRKKHYILSNVLHTYLKKGQGWLLRLAWSKLMLNKDHMNKKTMAHIYLKNLLLKSTKNSLMKTWFQWSEYVSMITNHQHAQSLIKQIFQQRLKRTLYYHWNHWKTETKHLKSNYYAHYFLNKALWKWSQRNLCGAWAKWRSDISWMKKQEHMQWIMNRCLQKLISRDYLQAWNQWKRFTVFSREDLMHQALKRQIEELKSHRWAYFIKTIRRHILFFSSRQMQRGWNRWIYFMSEKDVKLCRESIRSQQQIHACSLSEPILRTILLRSPFTRWKCLISKRLRLDQLQMRFQEKREKIRTLIGRHVKAELVFAFSKWHSTAMYMSGVRAELRKRRDFALAHVVSKQQRANLRESWKIFISWYSFQKEKYNSLSLIFATINKRYMRQSWTVLSQRIQDANFLIEAKTQAIKVLKKITTKVVARRLRLAWNQMILNDKQMCIQNAIEKLNNLALELEKCPWSGNYLYTILCLWTVSFQVKRGAREVFGLFQVLMDTVLRNQHEKVLYKAWLRWSNLCSSKYTEHLKKLLCTVYLRNTLVKRTDRLLLKGFNRWQRLFYNDIQGGTHNKQLHFYLRSLMVKMTRCLLLTHWKKWTNTVSAWHKYQGALRKMISLHLRICHTISVDAWSRFSLQLQGRCKKKQRLLSRSVELIHLHLQRVVGYAWFTWRNSVVKVNLELLKYKDQKQALPMVTVFVAQSKELRILKTRHAFGKWSLYIISKQRQELQKHVTESRLKHLLKFLDFKLSGHVEDFFRQWASKVASLRDRNAILSLTVNKMILHLLHKGFMHWICIHRELMHQNILRTVKGKFLLHMSSNTLKRQYQKGFYRWLLFYTGSHSQIKSKAIALQRILFKKQIHLKLVLQHWKLAVQSSALNLKCNNSIWALRSVCTMWLRRTNPMMKAFVAWALLRNQHKHRITCKVCGADFSVIIE